MLRTGKSALQIIRRCARAEDSIAPDVRRPGASNRAGRDCQKFEFMCKSLVITIRHAIKERAFNHSEHRAATTKLATPKSTAKTQRGKPATKFLEQEKTEGTESGGKRGQDKDEGFEQKKTKGTKIPFAEPSMEKIPAA